VETRTAGSASGLEKRTSGNADTALQADSTDPTGREGIPVDACGRWRQGQAPNTAGWRGTDLASGRRGRRFKADDVDQMAAG
jgi:hypothetical protein